MMSFEGLGDQIVTKVNTITINRSSCVQSNLHLCKRRVCPWMKDIDGGRSHWYHEHSK